MRVATMLFLLPSLALAQPENEVETQDEAAVETLEEDAAADATTDDAATESETEATTDEASETTETADTTEPTGDTGATEGSDTTAEPASVTAEVPPPASTGTTIERSGFYLGLGLGVGASSLSDDSLGGSPLSGTASLRLGTMINHQLGVGAQFQAMGQFHSWSENEVVGAALSAVMVEGTYFILPHLPLSVSAGAGWGSTLKMARLSNTSDDNPFVQAGGGNGIAWMGAVGWDFSSGRGSNVGLQVRYDGVNSGDVGTDHMGSLAFWLNFY